PQIYMKICGRCVLKKRTRVDGVVIDPAQPSIWEETQEKEVYRRVGKGFYRERPFSHGQYVPHESTPKKARNAGEPLPWYTIRGEASGLLGQLPQPAIIAGIAVTPSFTFLPGSLQKDHEESNPDYVAQELGNRSRTLSSTDESEEDDNEASLRDIRNDIGLLAAETNARFAKTLLKQPGEPEELDDEGWARYSLGELAGIMKGLESVADKVLACMKTETRNAEIAHTAKRLSRRDESPPRMYSSNHNPSMGADDMFNPIKKASMVAKFDLNSVQHVAISSAEAAAQHERNLQNPLIGPDMKRKIALDREIAEFAPEEEHRELDMRKAKAKLLLHGKATRMMRDGEFEEGNASHDALKQFALQSRDPLKTQADNATAIWRETTQTLDEIKDRRTKCAEKIARTARENRISTVEKINNDYFMTQRRTTGLILPRYLPQEITGNAFFKQFHKAEKLVALDSKIMIPILRALLESTPVEFNNDRMQISSAIEKLSTDKEWTRIGFIKFIQSIFTEDLEKDFQQAYALCFQSEKWRQALELSMDEDTRVDQEILAKRNLRQQDEKLVLERRKFGYHIHERLRDAASRVDKAGKKAKPEAGYGNREGGSNRRRGRGGSRNSGSQGGQGAPSTTQAVAQYGAKTAANSNRNKRANDGSYSQKKKGKNQPRQPPKAEPKTE
ncbi:unnamed protein product, partial [Oikopleura dioica]